MSVANWHIEPPEATREKEAEVVCRFCDHEEETTIFLFNGYWTWTCGKCNRWNDQEEEL